MSISVTELARIHVQHPAGELNESLHGCLRCDIVVRPGREEYGCRWNEPHNLTPLTEAVSQRMPRGTS